MRYYLFSGIIFTIILFSCSVEKKNQNIDRGIGETQYFKSFTSIADYKPKRASSCYRQICLEYNTCGRPNALPNDRIDDFFTEADPVVYAEYCKSLHLDAALLLAIPEQGYCTYETRLGQKFPGMRGDWFGETIHELHQRGIAAQSYITLARNRKYMEEHPEYTWVYDKKNRFVCLNSPYLDLAVEYTKEILSNYPVDALRFDNLLLPDNCHCEGCKAFYLELYHEVLPEKWNESNWRRQLDFQRASSARAVQRLTEAVKSIKPSIETWQNGFIGNKIKNRNNMEDARLGDVAYIEFGDPFLQLFLSGINRLNGIIVGKWELHPEPTKRLCLALGANLYSYFSVDHKTALPHVEIPKMMLENFGNRSARPPSWYLEVLAPFYQFIEKIEPFLYNAKPVSYVGIVYSEATRYRYDKYERSQYIQILRDLTESYLARSLPLEFISNQDLSTSVLVRYKLLVLPETSGLTNGQVDALRSYLKKGGRLVLSGDALRFDEHGYALEDFAMAKEMDLSYQNLPLPRQHMVRYGKGILSYLAAGYTIEDMMQVIDSLMEAVPVRVSGSDTSQVVLMVQPDQNRWILHLVRGGAMTIDIDKAFASPRMITGYYPETGWEAEALTIPEGLRIQIVGEDKHRIIILK